MQNPNEDTEWNDALRRHGILPQKEGEVTEDQLITMVEETVQRKTTGLNVVKAYEDMTLDELEELEDEEDERVLLQYRYKMKKEKSAFKTMKQSQAIFAIYGVVTDCYFYCSFSGIFLWRLALLDKKLKELSNFLHQDESI